ncbi:MAG: YfhO family protein [Tenericutes bacterium]|nr:YfhO family protein [Mycoplasmatota bacterium]
MKKLKALIIKLKTGFSNFFGKTFSDKKKTFQILAILVFSALFILQISMILINNSFYNNASDDVLQYYTIMVDFIRGLKEGTISWFNLNNYFGASFFSDVYYIPIDTFTGITFVLSYIMPTEVAYSITEFIKIFAGVMLFAYYLSLQKMKNRTIFWMGILYFIAGGTVSFMAFPVFLSLTVYMPLALIVIHFFFKKKRWLVPLFAMASIFYDFYLGYTVLAFSCIAFVLEYFKRPKFNFFRFTKEIIIFVALLLLGVLMAAIIAYPSITYILEETYRTTSDFNAWIVNIFGYELKLFQPDIYIRVFAKMFVEQKPVGFYGFENSYATEHFSLYISVIGFTYMNYIFFMRDKISRIYKGAIFLAIIFMILPIFSYVFSGTLDSPYTRWINMLPIFQIMILAHVFDKFGFEKVKMKFMTIIIVLQLAILGALVYYYISQLKLDDYLASRDMLTADTVLMCVAGLYLIVLLIFGWFKKWTVVKWFLWIEILVALGYAYSGPFYVRNKIDTFQNAYDIEEYLDEVIEDDEFYRVYIDINNLGVEDTNFNRMTGYATNTGIFHSWTDYETNDISYLLFNVHEYQSKNKMNTYGYYLNQFLDYKYLLVDAESNFAFDGDYFHIYAENENYSLYEVANTSPFQVYESYMSYTDFISYNNRNSDMATEKILLMAALIDFERYLEEDYNLEILVPANEDNGSTVKSYSTINTGTLVVVNRFDNESLSAYYKYDNADLDIGFSAGAIYIKSTGLSTASYDEVYMEFADETKRMCEIQENQSHQVKCEFSQTPTAVYFKDTDAMSSAPTFQIRQEAAINAAAYMIFDLSDLDIESDSGILSFAVNSSFNLERSFVLDEFGNQHECLDGFYSFDTLPDKIYAFKTNQMYEYSNLFTLTLRVSYENLEDSSQLLNQDFALDKYLSIEKGKINLRYINTSETGYDQIVVIPIVFSDDWQFTDGSDYETMSVSGGFLGIVIPAGVTDVNISMKFAPKGLGYGALGSLAGVLIYLAIFLPSWLKRRQEAEEIVVIDEVELIEEVENKEEIQEIGVDSE